MKAKILGRILSICRTSNTELKVNENLSHCCPNDNEIDSKADSSVDLAGVYLFIFKICQCL